MGLGRSVVDLNDWDHRSWSFYRAVATGRGVDCDFYFAGADPRENIWHSILRAFDADDQRGLHYFYALYDSRPGNDAVEGGAAGVVWIFGRGRLRSHTGPAPRLRAFLCAADRLWDSRGDNVHFKQKKTCVGDKSVDKLKNQQLRLAKRPFIPATKPVAPLLLLIRGLIPYFVRVPTKNALASL